MAAPTSNNEVTARRLTRLLTGADGTGGLWGKIKSMFVQKAGDTMSGRLTLQKPLGQLVTGTGTAGSSSGSPTTYYPTKWNFDLGIADPTPGDQLVIRIPCNGSDYGCYMSTDNGTTYYPVARSTGANRLTTHYTNGAYICVVFEAYVNGNDRAGQVNDIYPVSGGTARVTSKTGCWRIINDYDSGNTICYIRNENGRFYAGSTGCNQYSLVCLDKDGKFSMLTSSGSGTGTSKTINTAGKFKLDAVILYYAGAVTSANTLAATTYATYPIYHAVDTRYSHNHTTTFTANSPLYIECTIDSDGYWSPTTKCITQTLESGKYYIYLGVTYSTEYQLSLSNDHPIYYYDGTNLTERPRLNSDDRTKLDGISAGANKVTSSTNGKIKIDGTDTTVYTHPSYTAQSAKGSATKVPQITTDATGHVTGITEVTITGVTPASHTHGNIQNGGTLQTTDVTIASGDKLVVTDSSDSSKIARASVSFDGSTTTTALTPKGTFESFAKAADITSAIQALDVSSVGGAGKYISAISETDGKISATSTTMDTTPTASSTNAVTSGGIKTALDGKAPTSHASSATTYGIGTTANYGHVKLATGDMKDATHADGVAVSKNHTHSQYLSKEGGSMTGLTKGYFISSRDAMVGNEYNCLLNAKERGCLTFTQSGTGQLTTDQVWSLFDGRIVPAYSDTGIDPEDPYVLTIDASAVIGNTHTQAFAAFGWTCRYWWPTKFKVEGYNTWQSANTWVTLADYTNGYSGQYSVAGWNLFIPFGSATANPHTGQTQSGAFPKIRITIYQGDTTTSPANRWGISEIFYCYPEAYKVYSGLHAFAATQVTATEKSDNVNYKILATGSSSPTSGEVTSAIYDTNITMNPSTNTIAANLSGTASTAKAFDTSFTGTNSIYSGLKGKVDYTLLNDNTIIGHSAPAADCIAYMESASMPDNRVKILYNVPGNEATILFSKRFTYGSILKYGYADRYIYLLRKVNGEWKSDNWEKIYAGYADSAGTATTATTASDYNTSSGTIKTALDTKSNSTEGVYYVVGTHDYPDWTANTAYAVNDTVNYGNQIKVCKTAHTSGSSYDSSKWNNLGTPVLKGTIDGLTALYAGLKIAYKWPCTGGSSSTYLNINGLGNVYIRRNDSNITTHVPANSVTFLAYDDTYWRWADYDSNTNNWVTTMGAYCETASSTQAKTATSSNTVYTAGETFLIRFTNSNTYDGKITLNINGQGAKDVWINGAVSSSSNKTLPAGEHWCHYDGTKFLIWTDGTAQFTKLKADTFTGNMTGTTVAKLLTSSDDLNNYKGDGVGNIQEYYWASSSVPSNGPFNEAYGSGMIVYGTSGTDYAIQMVFRGSKGIYQRKLNAGTWGSWEKILVPSDIATGSSNGTIAVSGTNVSVKGLGSAAYTASTAYAASSHAHGNITNGGALQTTDVAIANGDKLVITDSSDSNKVARTSTSFDGSTTTTALTPKGTFESFAKSDTKNTAGSTDTSSKIYLIGATSQAANPQTYSQDTTYVDTDATLASTKVRVAEKCTLQFNSTTNALDFVFA